MSENENNSPKTAEQSESQLSDERLSGVSAGATEELHGAYNFLLEVAGATDQGPSISNLAFLKERAGRNGFSVKEQAIQDLEAVKDGIRDY